MINTKHKTSKKRKNAKIRLALFFAALAGSLVCCNEQYTPVEQVSEKVSMKTAGKYDSSTFNFRNGDLLFQDMDCGELCDAIEKVTKGINGKKFSHMGLVYTRNDTAYVIEAIGKNVHLIWLSGFVNRSMDKNGHPKIVVGRLKPEFSELNPRALKFAMSHIGTLYDDGFMYGNQKYYCSELVYDAYKYANNDTPFFHLEPMTFKDPKTGKTFPVWTNYYRDLKMPVPEGKPGCNPGSISCSDKIQIVKVFY